MLPKVVLSLEKPRYQPVQTALTHSIYGAIVPPSFRPVKHSRYGSARLPDTPRYHILVSTTPSARSRRDALGSPAYSYAFVVDALRPVLDQLGSWTLVDQPESRLSWHARKAQARGETPVHLAVNPLQDVFLAPDLPNILFPFWEFPHIPDRAFGTDSRQDWSRIVHSADALIAACTFTASALKAAGATCPLSVVPVPVPASAFDTEPWHASNAETIECRHLELESRWTSNQRELSTIKTTTSVPATRNALRIAFQRIAPRLGQRNVERIARIRAACRGRSPSQIALIGTRQIYRRTLRRWLSESAIQRIDAGQRTLLARLGVQRRTLDPDIPLGTLTIQGLVYTTFFGIGDPRKNPRDLLSAFLLAFKDRSDVTLVIKLATSPASAFKEVEVLRAMHETLGIAHACRIVAIADFLDDSQLDTLMRQTTYYVNTSHAEGSCLPLMQALASGRPAIAPTHTAMADYVDPSVAFVIGSDEEPCGWPHDPEQRLETYRQRLRWNDIYDAFRASARIADESPDDYAAMSSRARDRMRDHASAAEAANAFGTVLQMLRETESRSRAA